MTSSARLYGLFRARNMNVILLMAKRFPNWIIFFPPKLGENYQKVILRDLFVRLHNNRSKNPLVSPFDYNFPEILAVPCLLPAMFPLEQPTNLDRPISDRRSKPHTIFIEVPNPGVSHSSKGQREIGGSSSKCLLVIWATQQEQDHLLTPQKTQELDGKKSSDCEGGISEMLFKPKENCTHSLHMNSRSRSFPQSTSRFQSVSCDKFLASNTRWDGALNITVTARATSSDDLMDDMTWYLQIKYDYQIISIIFSNTNPII